MLPGARTSSGVAYTVNSEPSASSNLVGGVAVSATGQIHTSSTLLSTDQFVNGFLVSATGRLLINIEGTIVNIYDGVARSSAGAVIVLAPGTVPSATAMALNGVLLSPTGQLYVTNVSPP